MNKRCISAQIVADSITPAGARLTTFVLVFPRIVLAEFNTHRVFSRNSASSRAIPFNKMLESVEQDPFIPIKWMKDHSGMQGNEYFTEEEAKPLEHLWLVTRNNSAILAKQLAEAGVTKQIVNRLLEPFLWHTVIVTATDYENFFALRANEAAEIHIQELAYKMLEAYNVSTPTLKKDGEWHIPFGDKMDEERICTECGAADDGTPYEVWLGLQKLKIATARCARVSYTNFDGSDDYGKDIELYDRLSTMGHWSPFEHCAQSIQGGYVGTGASNFGAGWVQLRKMFNGENKSDERVRR